MSNEDRQLTYCSLGVIDYKEAWDLQKEIFNKRVKDEINDTLLLLEHPNTYTLGKIAEKNNLVGSEDYLKKNNISVYDIDRGGDITYHGPGQIVGYPIINLEQWKKDTHKYLRALEEVIMNSCIVYGLSPKRDSKYTGVWIGEKKIAAIGIKVSRWVTMHGFAFNVNTDLNMFKGIIPCGINDKDVTSLKNELGKNIPVEEVKASLLNNFKKVFDFNDVNYSAQEELTGELIKI
jgi:lipoate-protein ligase B